MQESPIFGLLGGNVIHLITELLPLSDQLALRRTCKEMYWRITVKSGVGARIATKRQRLDEIINATVGLAQDYFLLHNHNTNHWRSTFRRLGLMCSTCDTIQREGIFGNGLCDDCDAHCPMCEVSLSNAHIYVMTMQHGEVTICSECRYGVCWYGWQDDEGVGGCLIGDCENH